MTARTGTHNPRTVYVETPDGRSLFAAVAMSDAMAEAIATALNGVPPGQQALDGCPDAKRELR